MRWRTLGAAVLLVVTAAGTALTEPRQATAATPAGYTITGIDISHWQGVIDWKSVAASGEDFAYAKATEGMVYTDPNYAANQQAALENGMSFGAYHFGRPDLGNPRGQADRLVDVGGYSSSLRIQNPRYPNSVLPPMLDIEWNDQPGGDGCYKPLTPAAVVAWIAAFVDQVRVRTGRVTMIYTNPNWWNPCTNYSAAFSSNPLFVSRYLSTPPPASEMPAGWTKWTLWQYTSSGAVPGVTGNVDQNVFSGTGAEMEYLARNRISVAPRATPQPRTTPIPQVTSSP